MGQRNLLWSNYSLVFDILTHFNSLKSLILGLLGPADTMCEHKHPSVNTQRQDEEQLLFLDECLASHQIWIYESQVKSTQWNHKTGVHFSDEGWEDERWPLDLNGPYNETTIYLWTQTVWGHSWPSGVWSHVRGSGPSLATREEWVKRRKRKRRKVRKRERLLRSKSLTLT